MKIIREWLRRRRYRKIQRKMTRIQDHIWRDTTMPFLIRMGASQLVTDCRWLIDADFDLSLDWNRFLEP